MVRDTYLSKKASVEAALKKEKNKDLGFSVFRLLLFLIATFFFYLALSQNESSYFFPSLLFLILFLWMLKKHQKVRSRIREIKALIQVNENELQYLEGKLSPFDGGAEFEDANHLYSVDLDIFGKNSLFAHINRTSTVTGKRKLARELSHPSEKNILEKQAAVSGLGTKLDWRQNFQVNGQLMQENPNLQAHIHQWLERKSQKNLFLSPWLLYPLAAVCVSLLIFWFTETTVRNFYLFFAAFAVNLILVFSQFKKVSTEAHLLDNISSSMSKYSKNLQQIENLEVSAESKLLWNLKKKLNSRNGTASSSLKKLSKILAALEQSDNLVVKFVANGLVHYHLHVLRQLYNWKKTHGNEMLEWLNTVAEFDKWSSIANFAFNHPSFTYPGISGKKEITVQQLGHPFLPAGKRVANDLSFDQASFMILTGSNMSGKSTFLRAVGVNLVLMKIGSPVCANKMKSYPFTILTSMRQLDSLASGESYFQAEILRLKKIKQNLDAGKNCFVLLDEILRGTNSEDKREGTRLFLENISHASALGIVATHDVDIADLSGKFPTIFTSAYFESQVKNGNLTFDYKLRPGVCTTPNAIELMKAQGII